MSFSGEVKEEIANHIPRLKHCRIAELIALFLICGRIQQRSRELRLLLKTENLDAVRICFTLLRKTCRINADVLLRRYRTNLYFLLIKGDKAVYLSDELKLVTKEGDIDSKPSRLITSKEQGLLLDKVCCRRAFLMGAFLAGGTLTDPRYSYHLEIACQDRNLTELLQSILNSFEVKSKITKRKSSYAVYLKDGDDIVTVLNLMRASKGLMKMENERILKDVRSSINRRVNCETANIGKTVSAAVRQVQDIEYIRDSVGFDYLNDTLREMAEVRLLYPDTALSELGKYLKIPVGKSGVNHRLRRLAEIADDLRNRT